jgi:hypothetical protein
MVNFFSSCFYYFGGESVAYYFICNDLKDIEFIRGFSFRTFLLNNNIKPIEKKAEFVKHQSRWSGSMYLFDSIKAIADHFNNQINDDSFLFFDNDILINSPLSDMPILFSDWDILLYDISHEYIKNGNWMISDYNGLDSIYMKDIHFKPCGGEFIGIKANKLNEFYMTYEAIFPRQGLKTEEHYLSYMVSYLLNNEYRVGFINPYIKRIWTALRYSNKNQYDYNIKLLHLPSEKEFGLYYLSKRLCNRMKYDRNIALSYVGLRNRPFYLSIQILLKKMTKYIRRLFRSVVRSLHKS